MQIPLNQNKSVEHPFGIVDLNLKHIVKKKQDLHFNSLRKLKRKNYKRTIGVSIWPLITLGTFNFVRVIYRSV